MLTIFKLNDARVDHTLQSLPHVQKLDNGLGFRNATTAELSSNHREERSRYGTWMFLLRGQFCVVLTRTDTIICQCICHKTDDR